MLGRLQMSVERAISCYGNLTGVVFSEIKKTGADGKFKASKLEQVVKKIVKEQTNEENEPMMGTSPHGKGCKT